MLIQQLKEHIVKGSVYCVSKANLKIEFSSLVDTGYRRISNTLKVFDSHINSQRALLSDTETSSDQ